MILYSVIILICASAVAAFTSLFAAPALNVSAAFCVLATVGSTAAVILLDGLGAVIIRALPKKAFNHNKKIFCVSAKEKRFYDKLRIKKWKDKIPELGGFTNFHKNKVADPKNNEYVGRFLLEACYGIVIHTVTAITGFAVIFLLPLRLWYCFGLPVAVVNAVLNVLPAAVLRYNVYRLKILYKRNERSSSNASQQTAAQL